ncbi:hypothetical protein MMRN_46230 [Mycobacterium marinum]|nr:hypothetical protein MMRN_46230 [Mycobacterium marinum]
MGMVVPGTRVRLRAPRGGAPVGWQCGGDGGAGVQPQLGVVLVMAVWVASAGVVVAVVMGLVVWGMSLPVVPAVMGCRWRGRRRWCNRPRWWWHSRVRRGQRCWQFQG